MYTEVTIFLKTVRFMDERLFHCACKLYCLLHDAFDIFIFILPDKVRISSTSEKKLTLLTICENRF